MILNGLLNGLLLITLLPVCGSRGIKTIKISVLVVMMVVVGTLVVMRTTSIMAKIRVVFMLGKMNRGQ